MDSFSYLSVLLSIILGLGLTQLLTAAGRLIRRRDRVRFEWLPLLWAALLVVVYVQVWWAMYGLRLRQSWSFVDFCAVLAQTATLYMMAALILPEEIDDTGTDLGEYFDRHHRWFFGFFLVTLGLSVAKDLIINGQLPDPTNLAFHGVFAAGCIAGLAVPGRRFQQGLAIAFAIGLVAYIGVLFARLR